MPYVADSPKALTVLQYDRLQAVKVLIDDEHGEIRISYDLYMGDKKVKAEHEITVPAAPYAVLYPDGAKTWYWNVKNLAYYIAEEQGLIGPGKME